MLGAREVVSGTTVLSPLMIRKLTLVVGLSCALVGASTPAAAQQGKDDDDLVKELLWALFGPDWNLFANVGIGQNGRFLLQRPDLALIGQRALRSNTGFAFGAGAGVDVLLRMGWRLSYNYNSNDLEFRTDNGDGSNDLDIDDIGTIRSHTVALEVMRYMLPSTTIFTPYASVGVLGTWWSLDDESIFVVPAGGSTQFRWGALTAFGLQGRVADHWRVRLEGAVSSIGNPFTGNESFRALGGIVVEEPTKVSKRELRLIGLYSFGKPKMPSRERVREEIRERTRERRRP